tara:strand:+ start:212 stop:415 length:204 start_codon:yes stop_codon:yes gene_type:complete
LKIKKIFICGIALDFCINYIALDAKSLGFETIVIQGATLPYDIGDPVKIHLKDLKKGTHYGKLDKFI